MSTPPPRASGPALFALLLLASACTEGVTDPDTGNEVTGVAVSLELNPVPLPSTVQATVAVTPSGAPQGVTWSSSDPEVATVDGSGLVTTRLRGTTTITATSTANPEVSGSVVLNTECPEPRRVTSITGGVATWENWVPDPVCFDYVVEASLITSSGTLVIEPGAVVGFEENVGLRVTSAAGLIAAGTEAEPILLTGMSGQRGFWKGVSLESSTFTEHVVTHTTIEYTGGASISQREDASLMISSGVTVRLEDNTLRHAEGYGLFLGWGADVVGEGNNTLTANTLGAAFVSATEAEHLKPGGDLLLGNDVDVVTVDPTRLDDAHVWPRATYRVLRTGPQELNIFGLLTLTPGTEVRMVGDQAVLVWNTGGLNAVGTATDPILITGDEAVAGHWRGLAFVGSDHADNALEHVTIEYGGGAAIGAGVSDRANLSLIQAGAGTMSRVRIRNSSFRGSAEFGIHVSRYAELVDFTGNVLTQNTLGPASMDPAVVDDIQPGNDFTGNDVDEITVNLSVNMGFDGPTTWIDPGVPYFMKRVSSPISAVEGQAFTLEPGVEMLFGPDVGLTLGTGSSLTAEGTSTNRISLRGRSGAWRGLHFQGATGSLDHIDIADGGSHAWGSELEPGQISLRVGFMSAPALVNLGGNVAFSGGGFNLAFGYGDTVASGCVLPVFIPSGDVFADHCL